MSIGSAHTGGNRRFDVREEVQATGYLPLQQPQEIGFASELIGEAKSEAGSTPDVVALLRQGSIRLALEQIQLAGGSRVFVQGQELCFALLDSESASLDAELWYESKVVWSLGKELPSASREQALHTSAAHPEE